MKPFFKRSLRVLLFGSLAAGTLLALVYAEEDWRGARAWALARRDLQAKGESLDLRDFIPPSIPDHENLAMAPLFVRVFKYGRDPAGQRTFGDWRDVSNNGLMKQIEEMPFGKQSSSNSPLGRAGNWVTGHATDFPRLQRFCLGRKDIPGLTASQPPAESVLLALGSYGPLLDELDHALTERPKCRFPVDYGKRPVWSISLPQYNFIQVLTRILRMRASAALACGRKEDALRDIEDALALRRATAYDPTIIAGLVDSTDLFHVLQPVWEGLAARQWSAADLDRLQNDLRGIDVLSGYLRGMRGGERAMFCVEMIEDFRHQGNVPDFVKALSNFFNEEGGANWYQRHIAYLPQGWYEQNAALISQFEQRYLVDPVHPADHCISLAPARALQPALEHLPLGPDTFLLKWVLPTFDVIIGKFAQTQAAVNHAVVACALEKYYLDHHAYPATLAPLTPDYLDRAPIDVIDGGPMHYQRTVDGRYQLYSIGWDGEDGGGVLEWLPDRKWRQANRDKDGPGMENLPNPLVPHGDWVWRYAPAEPPDPPENQTRLEPLPASEQWNN